MNIHELDVELIHDEGHSHVYLHRNTKMARKSLIFIIFQKGKKIINQHLSAVLLHTSKMLRGH